MASQWFCEVLGQEIGPVGFREMVEMVRAGTLKEDDRIRRDGTSEWIRAQEVIGLFRAATKEPAKAQPQAKAQAKPTPAPVKAKEGQRPSAEPPRIGRRRVVLAGGFVLGLVILVTGISVWRANRRQTLPEARQRGPRVVHDDPLAPLLAERSSTALTPVPDDPLPQPAGADVAGLKAQFTLDFREDFETQAINLFAKARPGGDTMTRPSAVDQFAVEPAGLRMTIPSGSPVELCRGDLRIRLQGDFQITARYTILNLERPTGGYGSGVGITVEETGGEQASLQRLIYAPQRHVFAAVRGQRREDGTYGYRKQRLNTSSEALSGWLRLARVGSSVRYQIAAPHSEQFLQFHEDDFPLGDVGRVMFKNQPGRSPTAVDVVWSYLDVQAEEIIKEY